MTKLDVDVGAVAFDEIVVDWFVSGDQVGLQDEGFLVGADREPLDTSCFGDHVLFPDRARSKILLEPFFDVDRFADIQNPLSR